MPTNATAEIESKEHQANKKLFLDRNAIGCPTQKCHFDWSLGYTLKTTQQAADVCSLKTENSYVWERRYCEL